MARGATREELAATIGRLQSFTTRFAWTSLSDSAALYLASRAEAMGLVAELDTFYFQGPTAMRRFNVRVALGPEKGPRIVLGAHYDTISRLSYLDSLAPAPGADDNGSGCAVLLEVLRALGTCRLDLPVEVVFFGAEEIGRRGSEHYASELASQGAEVLGMVSVDAVGYQPDSLWRMRAIFDSASRALAQKMLEAYRRVAPQTVLDTIYLPTWQSSDQYSFWSRGFPALHLYEGADSPYFHSEADTLGAVDLGALAATTEALVDFVLALAGAPAGSPALVASPPYPNPSAGPFTVDYRVSAKTEATVEVVDLAGRRVETISRAPLPAGEGRIVWNPSAQVAPGIYFVVFSGPWGKSARKVVLLR